MNNKLLISVLLTLLSGCATNDTSSLSTTAGIGHGAAGIVQSSVSKKALTVPASSQYSRTSANSSKKEYLSLTTQPGLYVLSEEKPNQLENMNLPESDAEVFSPVVPLKQYSNHKNKSLASGALASSANNSGRYKVSGENAKILPLSNGSAEQAVVPLYESDFHGEKTSNGETNNMQGMNAAHKRLPIASYKKVTNFKDKHSAVLRINDREPLYAGVAAQKHDIYQPDTERIRVEAIPTHHKEPVYLQLGVFSNPENAQQLRRKLVKNQMPEPVIKEIRIDGKLAYRVQLGPLFSTAKVNDINAKLVKMGISETWYVTENKL